MPCVSPVAVVLGVDGEPVAVDTALTPASDVDALSSTTPRRASAAARNMNEHGVFLHVLGDALGSVGVIASALVMKYAPGRARFVMDPLVSLFIVALISMSAVPLAKQCFDILLHRAPTEVRRLALVRRRVASHRRCAAHHTPHTAGTLHTAHCAALRYYTPHFTALHCAVHTALHTAHCATDTSATRWPLTPSPRLANAAQVDMPALRRALLRIPGILGVHELHVWQLSGDRYIGTVHANCQVSDGVPQLIDNIKQVFHQFNVHNTTIQPEFVDVCRGVADHCHEPVCVAASACAGSFAHR